MRGAIGGLLMGLANLVPGISGGTMLLASGVYPGFVGAIAELTRLRFRASSLALLGSIGATAALAILLLAGPTKQLVIEQRWMMYSLFIGLTLGGAPIVWRMARPATPALWAGAALGLAAMIAMTFAAPGASAQRASGWLLFGAGLVGAAAMVLPGVSGGYLLLVLGQYLVILGAVEELKEALRPLAGASAPDWALLRSALGVVVPVGLGVAAGIAGVSNLMRWTLVRFPKPTLGVLLGLLVGAVVGLWPFQASVPPSRWSPELAAGRSVERPEEWPVERFAPRAGQVLGALALIGAGLVLTSAVGRLGEAREERDSG